jgi:hypothetical protein
LSLKAGGLVTEGDQKSLLLNTSDPNGRNPQHVQEFIADFREATEL